MQTTIRSGLSFTGMGLHSGRPVSMRLRPARAGQGIRFRRTDVTDRDAIIPARWDLVVQGELCTRLVNAAGTEVSTVEHVMAALAGCGVHNVTIEIDGPEVPIMDGSAAAFASSILSVGLTRLDAPLSAIEILEPVEVSRGEAWARIAPRPGFEIDFRIDFADPAIGRQERRLDLANGAFVHELADCRTFCRRADVEAMRARGLALGGTLDNAVVVDGARILTPGGLRRADEAVRHKMLDALGDLALAGAPLRGLYTGNRAGHAMTNALLRALFDRPEAWRRVPVDDALAARLPGAGLTRADAPLLVA